MNNQYSLFNASIFFFQILSMILFYQNYFKKVPIRSTILMNWISFQYLVQFFAMFSLTFCYYLPVLWWSSKLNTRWKCNWWAILSLNQNHANIVGCFEFSPHQPSQSNQLLSQKQPSLCIGNLPKQSAWKRLSHSKRF